MSITAAMVKDLREKTAAGMMDCKKALTECDADMEKAVDWLRQKRLSKAGLNPEVVEHEREVYRQKAREEGKPEQIIEKIAEGAVKKFCKDVCLLDQLYIRDDKMTISDLIKGTAKTIGEPITVVRFVRIQLGAE